MATASIVCYRLPIVLNSAKLGTLNQIRLLSTTSIYSKLNHSQLYVDQKRKNYGILLSPKMVLVSNKFDKSIIQRLQSTQTTENKDQTPQNPNQSNDNKKTKKQSKFKQFYSQYGPLFLVVHLTTVVLWIYFFFIISKQGYDITQLLNIFHKLNIMTKERVDSIHEKIDNYKMESGWITGANLKHFATAYMIYKVIAPFRYMVSIYLVRVLVKGLRAKGLMKS